MIPSLSEVIRSLYGAWRLLRFDRNGLTFFEDSVEAFWRSFFAAVIVLPGYAILKGMRLAELSPKDGLIRIVVIEGLAYVILWVALPLVLYSLCEAFGRENRFIRAVVALNWASVLHFAIIVPVHLMAASGLLPGTVGGFATFAVFVFLTGYLWFVVRVALDATPAGAAGVVMLKFVINLTVMLITQGLVR